MYNRNNYGQSRYNSTRHIIKAPPSRGIFKKVPPTEIRLVSLKLKIIGIKRIKITYKIQIIAKKLFEIKLKLKILGKILIKKKSLIATNGSIRNKIDLSEKLIGVKYFYDIKLLNIVGELSSSEYKKYELFGKTLNKVALKATINTLKKLASHKKLTIEANVKNNIKLDKSLYGKKIFDIYSEEKIEGSRDVRKIFLALIDVE